MKTVLCYGGSNTWGYKPDPAVVLPIRYPYSVRWTGVLQAKLGNQFLVVEEGLNSRTTVIDDPLNDDRNGKAYLKPCLESHAPLDFVVFMLGTNDLKVRFGLSAYEIVYGIETLVLIVKTYSLFWQDYVPEILVLTPPPLGKLSEEEAAVFVGAKEKLQQIAHLLQASCIKNKYHLLNTHAFIQSDELDGDGIHLPEECHNKLGIAVGKKILEISH